MILHQFEASPFCEKVRRILHFKRRSYESREVAPTNALVSLRRLSPAGKVPVLEHGDKILGDSTLIARYLDETFPDPPLLPDSARERGLCHLLEDWADEALYFYQAWLRFGVYENAPEWSARASESEPPLLRGATRRALPTVMRQMLRSQGIGRRPPERILEEFEHHLHALSGWLEEGDWLVSDRLTLADIAVYAQLAYAIETGEGAQRAAGHKTLLEWMERVNAATGPAG